ncbi:glycine cleavage system aminomethyltransferase GcvT [Halobaculum sp. MBLA0147]|uniref:glycine cleavage system aminomethyltransferase GcvT n=1 Tax=Halobaculum sp. MBLA0147 TaxID=3079934 RepID=UPI003524FBB1
MSLRTPPLRETHADRGAKFTEFGGWDMPVEFDSISAEHEAVRESVGIFDVSHMGEIEVTGPDATTLLQRLTTNDVTALDPGEAQYSALVREDGVMLDDTVVYRLPDDRADELDATAYLFVPNAGNDGDTHDRWVDYRDEHDLDATVRNATEDWAMFAVQGPEAPALVDAVASVDTETFGRFDAGYTTVADTECWLARTGYTGEDGFELLCPWEAAETVWGAFDEAQPCGLGARDTLRIEEGFLLSGQDFHPEEEPRTPFEAGIGFAVDLDTEFVGRDALADATEPTETFVGLELLDRGVARHGYDVTDDDGHVIGTVTSGTKVPTLERAVGLGYLPTSHADPGTHVNVVVRGQEKRAQVVRPPFGDD